MKIKDIVSTVKNVKGWGSNLCVESENGIFYLTCRTERIGDMELVKIVDSEEKNFYVFSGKFSNFDIIINETLRDGEAIVTNSGMGWYFNIDKEMFKEIEKLSSYLGFDASKLLNNKKFFGKNLYCCIYDITKEKALYNYLFVFDNDNGELLFYTTIQPKELEKISKLLINIEKLSSSQIKTALYVIAEKYMEEEYRRVHSPYYDLQELIISDWKENGNEAEFFYKMTFLYYNRDPDKAQYIQEAKKINQEKYETLYEDYLALKETNAHFKIVLDGQKISLYYDVGPKGVEWSPIEIDDFVKGGENKKAGTVAGLGKGAFKTAKNLSQRDISYIENTLNSFKWQNSTADCLNDFVISIEGKEYYYHSDCGTINDNKNNRSLNLSDEYKQELNIILFNYADNKPTKENFLYQLNVKNVTPTGLTLVFNVFGGTTATDITASGWYNIEKKNGKEWESITTEKEKVYNDMAYIIYKGKETEIELDWSYLYGKLENGKYRIVKELQWFYPSKKFEKSLVYAEFEI